jgi:hypothetical protein
MVSLARIRIAVNRQLLFLKLKQCAVVQKLPGAVAAHFQTPSSTGNLTREGGIWPPI